MDYNHAGLPLCRLERSMQRTFILMSLFLILLAGCSSGTPIPVTAPPEGILEAEELQVYTVLLQGMHPGKTIVLMDQTEAQPLPDDLIEQMPELLPETAASYQARNAVATTLAADMSLGVEFSLMDMEEMRALFNVNQDGWGMFYNRYPDAAGITTLAQVGFNDTLDQALVSISTQSHWLRAASHLVLLAKADGIWTVVQKIMTGSS